MRKFLDRLLTGLAIAFAIPSTLILISWNAIPGDRLYSIKAGLEDVALALTANTPLASVFSLEFTNRRFNEATILLAKEGSTVGYELLVAEARQTQAIILGRQDAKNGSQLIGKIKQYQVEIEKKQVEVRKQVTTPSPPLVVKKPVATAPPKEAKEIIVSKPVTVVIKEEEPEEVIENLEEVQEELEEIKEELEEELPTAPSIQAPEKDLPAAASDEAKEKKKIIEEVEKKEKENKFPEIKE